MEALGLPLRQSTLDSQATDETDDVFEDAQEAFSESPVENPAAYKHGDVPSIQGGRADGIASSDYSDAERGNYHTAASLAIPQQTVTLNLDPEAAGPSHSQHAASHAKPCDICEDQGNEVWFCNVCTIIFCQRCWDAQALHRLSRPGPKHEKTSPEVAAKVQNVLSPPVDERVRERLYRSDAPTAWFGVDRPDDLGPPVFQDYGRFTDLMIATDPVRSRPSFFEQWADVGRDRRTPSLVSFVGQTGAGKSTLVKLLIDFAMTRQDNYSTPVIGPRGAHIPTSEDVHLYLDPRTADSKGPLLYADCEGLEGGEREPLGAMFKRKLKQETSRDPGIENNISKANVISERELQWANAPRARSREFAVTNLYPRLLYTFSDVIVFVLRNPRVIEHVFERLVKWAAAAIETSSNQPVLPHAIIALNASEHDLDDSLWDVKHNTETILEDLAYTVNRNETFKKGAQFWRERGKVIDNLLDLVLCYYSSIQVIRLPADGRPKLMGDQIGKLYHATLTACIAARCVRYEARMLLDVEDQQAYLQEAFSHYSNTLESPFDFVQASFRNSPIPPDFGGNILKLALSMMNILGSEQHIDAKGIFSELSWMVASCIMLDSARNKNKGSASQIFPKYINHLDDALENFCDQHWPCEFVNPKTGVRCVNVRSGHTAKGHQSADGKVFAAGEWKSTFSFNDNANRFRNWVYYCLVELLRELTTRVQDGGEVEDLVASDIHKTMVLRNLFSHAKHSDMGAKEDNYLVSHTACFCCLFGQAEHVLPCGHVLCTACVSAYGHPRGANGFAILECPFEGPMNKRQSSWIVHLKPKSAGVRVVTLDGGGIRGIVELEALRQIEIALGGVPIRCFVDLLVGTSTGGLVALGLGTMEWTVDECIGHFEALCHEAFTRRVGSTLPLLGSLVENYHHSKYQTTTLEKAYTSAFTDDTYLFGGRRPFGSSGSLVKVAVTATSLAGNRTYIFSNYNRPRDSHKTNQYHFQRPELLGAEVKVWEAARATSAAPRYFKSFHHEPSQKTYIDGAVLHNNPVRIADSERTILWPDCHMPDLFLSFGTGYSPSLARSGSERMEAARKGIFNHGRQLYSIMRSNLEQTLDCERAWDDYFSGISTVLEKPYSMSRFIRINPNIGDIPALDAKDKMGSLRTRVQATLSRDPRVKDVARQLIASSFYFDLLSSSAEPDGKISIQGKIRCRLLPKSKEFHDFSRHLQERTTGLEQLSFVIFEDGDEKPLASVPLTSAVADMMTRDCACNLRRVRFAIKNRRVPTQMHMYFGTVAMHPISGFPRVIAMEGGGGGGVDEGGPGAMGPNILAPQQPAVSTSRSFRYTHGSRRLKKPNGSWQPPDIRGAAKSSSLYHYASHPEQILGRAIVNYGADATTGTDASITVQQHQQQQKLQVPEPPPLTPGGSETPISQGTGRRRAVREAFRALLSPLRAPSKTEALSPDFETWLAEYRRAQRDTPEAAALGRPSESMVAALQQYNVRPGEYAVYQQWVRLLQPGLTPGAGPGPGPGPGQGYLSPASAAAGVYEMSDRSMIVELEGTSTPWELEDTSYRPQVED